MPAPVVPPVVKLGVGVAAMTVVAGEVRVPRLSVGEGVVDSMGMVTDPYGEPLPVDPGGGDTRQHPAIKRVEKSVRNGKYCRIFRNRSNMGLFLAGVKNGVSSIKQWTVSRQNRPITFILETD
jgi:hypothetical protein